MMNSRIWKRAAMGAALGFSLCAVLPAHAQNKMSDQDKQFVKEASSGNQAEIDMGKLAAEKAKNPEVKAFGARMVKDHTALGEKMKPFLNPSGVNNPSPTVAQRAKLTELHALQGDSFDKAYVEAMVKDHHEDLNKFTQERDSAQDPTLKKTVAGGAEVIRQHTQMIDSIAKKMNISTPAQ